MKIRLPNVTRVNTPDGHRWEPPLDTRAAEPAKLAWHAAVVAAQTGIAIDLQLGDGTGRTYAITLTTPNGSFTGITLRFDDAWIYLVGVADGAAFTRPTGTP